MARRLPQLAFVGAIAYVLVLGWGMQRWSYDTWGALMIAPVLAAVSVPLIRRLFSGELAPLRPVAYAGLAAKVAGSTARYWVAFDAYGGSADAGRYHDFGKQFAGQMRGGERPWFDLIPSGTGTQFLERLTGTVYTVFGSSRLAGFFVFAWLGFWGAAFAVRAATTAVPGLAQRRYAALVFLLPSMVFWPSSIGKEAWMLLCLGLAMWAGAELMSGGRAIRWLVWGGVGLTGAALVRPHLAGMWLAAITVGLMASVFVRRVGGRQRSRGVTFAVLGVALVSLTFVVSMAIRYLDPADEAEEAPVTDRVTAIFEETERRSEQGGSGFETIRLGGPQTWPYAIVRTLTRPLPHEANSFATLLPAAEMGLLLVMGVVGWRRWRNVPSLLRTTPYVATAVVLLIMWGLAYVSIGNLGILTRQRSLVLPWFVLLWCVPARTPATSVVPSVAARDALPVS